MSDSEYVVERILNVRIRNGIKEYLLKWEGYDESESTWEPEWNLNCHKLVREFERSRKVARVAAQSRGSAINQDSSVEIAENTPAVPTRKEVEKILNVKTRNSKGKYLIDWKERPDSETAWKFEEKLACSDLLRKFDQSWSKDVIEADMQSVIEMERNRNTRTRGSKREYFLKWKDRPQFESARKPERRITNPYMLKKFHESRIKDKLSCLEKTFGIASTSQAEKRKRPFDWRAENNKAKGRKISYSDEVECEGDKANDKSMALKYVGGFHKLPSIIIEGATETDGEFVFIIKWPGAIHPVLMTSNEANKRFPQAVIAFYEKNLTFHDPKKGNHTQ